LSYFYCEAVKKKENKQVFSVDSNQKSESIDLDMLKGVSRDFLYWFSGFTDAEGNFLISLDRGYVRFRFKICLHIDDIETLNIIKNKLCIGRVMLEASKGSCSFVVDKFADIKMLSAIFKTFPLLTNKKLDFESFYKAVYIKDRSKKTLSEKEIILTLKSGMNSKRNVYSKININNKTIINPNWLMGFIGYPTNGDPFPVEGEGTFGIKTWSSLYIQVAQKNTSQVVLNAIADFYTSLPASEKLTKDSKILPLNVLTFNNKRTNVTSLVINSIDSLYYYILPYIDSYTMYTRKAIDYKLWKAALLLKIHGYFLLPEGKALFMYIADIVNKRYSTKSTVNIDESIASIFVTLQVILATTPPFKVQANIPHIDNVRTFSIANRSEKQRTVYIYKDNKLLQGSPFSSYSLAHQALGLRSSSNTCNRYIDTGKLYKKIYLITSEAKDLTS